MSICFDSLQTDNYNRQNIDFCKKYADSFDEMLKDGKGLLIWGNTGTGKSFAAEAIANRVQELGFSCVMISFIELISALNSDGSGNNTFIRDINCANLIILDDFDPELFKESALKQLYKIIEERYQKKLPMIITTNLTPNEMDNTIGTYAQIYDRLLECCYLVQFTGPNRNNASEQRTSLKEIARRFLETTVPPAKLREICRDYNIEADEGATYRDLLRIAVLKRAQEGDKEAAELVKEFDHHE